MSAAVGEELAALARPLADAAVSDALVGRVGDASVVMLGEATHGTSRFYEWRAELSLRLVREKGFRFLAVEGDWPDCFRINRCVKGDPGAGGSALEALHAFARWPSWMWANHEVADLLEELRTHNDGVGAARRVGFYGLDVYSLWDSMRRVVHHLDGVSAEAAAAARAAWACFEPYGEDAQRYALATQVVPTDCREAVVSMLVATRRELARLDDGATEARLDAEQNALVALNAEAYYRAMVEGGPLSWNVRDTHMMDTLDRLLAHHEPGAKAIVWAHNTHIGDARATDMAAGGMTNLGRLARERRGLDDVALVGLGVHHGSVVAARAWEAPMRRMAVPAARAGSLEDQLHREVGSDCALLFHDATGLAEVALRHDPFLNPDASGLLAPVGHRAIGVVYHPERERGNYVPTVLPLRYDAFVHFERAEALRPIHLAVEEPEAPETFPFGT